MMPNYNPVQISTDYDSATFGGHLNILPRE
jgi:hypothetical protein